MIRSNIDEDIWNNTNQSLMSFVGYESEADGQFRCWDANQTIFNPNFPQPTMGFNQNINPYSEITHHSADFMKREEDQSGFNTTEEADYSMGRIGLKLGHRTYFSSREAAMIDRLFKRPRGFFQATQIPRCQAEGCKVDLTNAKHYHRRHKVCEFHSKAIRVLAGGAEQRFCQQCSRFHLLSEFDEMKRSCRKRLADHNRRRRKSQTGSSDSVSAKNTVNGFAQGSSSSSLNINEMSTSETLLFAMAKDEKANSRTRTCLKEQNHGENDETQFQKLPLLSSSYLHDEQKSFFLCANDSQFVSTNFLSNNSTYQNPFYSSSNEASPSTGGGSDHSQQHRNELQNMLHLGQSIFEVELL